VNELDALKEEFASLGPRDRRWIVVCAMVATAALLYALVVGSVAGDILGFILAVATGWLIHSQWQLVTHPSRHEPADARTPSGPPTEPRGEPSRARWHHRATSWMRLDGGQPDPVDGGAGESPPAAQWSGPPSASAEPLPGDPGAREK